MSSLAIDFAWGVDDAGYKLAPRTTGTARKPDRRKGSETLLAPSKNMIVRNGGTIRHHNPTEFNRTLFLQLAYLDPTPEACCEFANKFGFLGYWVDLSRADAAGATPEGEEVSFWLKSIESLRSAVDMWQSDAKLAATLLNPQIQLRASVKRMPPDGKPRLSLQPPNLISAIHLQFIQAVISGTDIQSCDECGTWFECGSETGRKRGSRFCSDQCRYKHNNHKRSKGTE